MDVFARVMNKVPVAILRSPLHHLMSKKYCSGASLGLVSGATAQRPL